MVRPINYVWNYFDKQVKSGAKYGICKACLEPLKMTDGSTGSIRHHLRSRHPLQFAEMQLLQAAAERQKKDELLEVVEAQTQLNVAKGKSFFIHFCLFSNIFNYFRTFCLFSNIFGHFRLFSENFALLFKTYENLQKNFRMFSKFSERCR